MKKNINELLNQHIDYFSALAKSDYSEKLLECIELEISTLQNGSKIFIAGNGGSAADAQHFAAELVGRFKLERKALACIALTTDTSIITAMSNDYSFDEIYSRQLEALANKGDLFIGITTSGNSKNIIKAIQAAKSKKVRTIGLLGKDGGQLKALCDYNITVPFKETERIQEAHIFTIHVMCELIETALHEDEVNS